MVNNDKNDNEFGRQGEVEEDAAERKFVRRTLVDRRRHTHHLGYKGHQRRYHIRRLKNDRRDVPEPEKDDLGKHIP